MPAVFTDSSGAEFGEAAIEMFTALAVGLLVRRRSPRPNIAYFTPVRSPENAVNFSWNSIAVLGSSPSP